MSTHAQKMSESLMRQALQKKDEEIAAKDFAIALLKKMMCESCKNKIANNEKIQAYSLLSK